VCLSEEGIGSFTVAGLVGFDFNDGFTFRTLNLDGIPQRAVPGRETHNPFVQSIDGARNNGGTNKDTANRIDVFSFGVG